MDDLPFDAIKLLDTKTAEKFYEDAVSPPAKQIGGIGADLIKSLRLFTAPIQLLAACQDRLVGLLDDVRTRVPPERQVEAPASIAGPVLMNLRFIEDDNPLRALYLNLLARAIDKDRQKEAHPAFVKIIEQLSPDEAQFFDSFSAKAPTTAHRYPTSHTLSLFGPTTQSLNAPYKMTPLTLLATAATKDLEGYQNRSIEDVELLIERLQALGLFKIETDEPGETGNRYCHYLIITSFGQKFLQACFPERKRPAPPADWSSV
jgi:hypothetical protein